MLSIWMSENATDVDNSAGGPDGGRSPWYERRDLGWDAPSEAGHGMGWFVESSAAAIIGGVVRR
jgi:hypothetical protein